MISRLFLISLLILSISADPIGNLDKYKEDSARRAKLPPGTNQVVFMGSSMCEWWNPFFPGKPYVNRGIAGETTPQFISRFQQDVIALKPRVVVIYGGSNDLAGNTGFETIEQIQNYFKTMHQLAKTNGFKVVQGALTPVCGDKKDKRPPQAILKLNKFLKDYCQADKDKNCVFADFHSALVNKVGEIDKALTTDCMHPSKEAYAIMNPVVEKAIQIALATTNSPAKGHLERYKDDSARRAKLPVGTNQVIFIGGSITEWWNPFFPGKPYVNRGIVGETVPEFIVRLEQDVLALKPKVLVLMGGSNDIAGVSGYESMSEIQGFFKKVHDIARANKIKVVQAALTPVCGDQKVARPPDEIVELNSYLKNLCNDRLDCAYADFHALLVNQIGEIDKNITKDCLNPNDAGYALMVPVVEDAINYLLTTPYNLK